MQAKSEPVPAPTVQVTVPTVKVSITWESILVIAVDAAGRILALRGHPHITKLQ